VIASYEHSSLFGLIISNEGKKFYNVDARSSADDDDSDPCTSYPYLPLDDSPESLLARRHSLPFTITFYDEDMFVLVNLVHLAKTR
jgi:hypothetical protein